MRFFAYIRVSTREQNEDRQLAAIADLRIPVKNIYVDKESGRTFERENYLKMRRRLRKGDLLYLKSIDRLGRNYHEILEQWRLITKDIGADIVVLDMPLLDTRIGKDLTGVFISDLVLQILSYVAESEYRNIKIRQREGIESAKARGVVFGRPRKALPEGFEEAVSRWKRGEISMSQAALEVNMPLSTFSKKARQTGSGFLK